jgi:hypothetical protein
VDDFLGTAKGTAPISEAIVSALGFASRCWASWRWPYSAAQLNALLIWEMIRTTVQKWISFSFFGLVGTPHKVTKSIVILGDMVRQKRGESFTRLRRIIKGAGSPLEKNQ